MRRLQAHLLLSTLTLVASPPLHAACKLSPIARLPIIMEGLRPIVSAQVNGADAKFVADTGSFYSMMTPANAAQLKLSLQPAPRGYLLIGAGMPSEFSITRVKDFALAESTLRNFEFVVGGFDTQGETVGRLGLNLFRVGDVEYSLADGAIRLIKPEGCAGMPLAFWAAGKPYSEIAIDSTTSAKPHTVGTAYVNGNEIRVLFDTGAPVSVLSLGAAARAGVKPGDAGLVSAGYGEWIAPFASFKIGDEEIRNTRLRIGHAGVLSADMLIGVDFFLSHHIYVANSQRKLYFTYNGGPVFNLAPHAQPASGSGATAAEPPEPVQDAAAEAERFALKGRTESARGQLEQAIADLTKACVLKPEVGRYFFERAQARLANKQPAEALADYEKAIELDSNDVAARMRVAELQRSAHRNDEAYAQLDVINRLIPRESDLRLELAELYNRVDRGTEAIAQYDLWIAAHKADIRMASALNARCWVRASSGDDLDKALADCDAALKLSPTYTNAHQGRGLVLLRQGRFARAISDFSDAMDGPHDAWSLYGRGLAELRSGNSAGGRSDIDAATVFDSHVAERFAKLGLSP